jgi:2-aminoadipate transaminase
VIIVTQEILIQAKDGIDFKSLLADRTHNMTASIIRETLKALARPDMISLGGGNPAPESFPLEIIHELALLVIRKYKSVSLQYGPSEGFPPLREALVELLSRRGIKATANDIIISTGSQGALQEIGQILISKGDEVAVEAPTYMGALAAFNPFEPSYVSIATDEDGVIPDALRDLVCSHHVKFIYLIPTFQNPTGRTIPIDRRREIADIAVRHSVLIVEDDPYSALRYEGDPVPPIKAFAPDNTIYISTFSKILSPGLRLGFCVAPPPIKTWMVLAKQGIDLHTSSLDQAIAAEYITGGHLERHIPAIIDVNRPRLEAMLAAIESFFPDDFKWSRPEGGMFVWAEGPPGFDSDKIYVKAIERNVAFIPGRYFFTDKNEGKETMRLNFTMADTEKIVRGIRILAEVIKGELSQARAVTPDRVQRC